MSGRKGGATWTTLPLNPWRSPRSRRVAAARLSGRPRRPCRRPPSSAGLTVAISREAGARGGTIGRRVGRKLGWQVYDQELLEYVAQEGVVRQGVLDDLPPAAAVGRGSACSLLREQSVSQHPSILNLARVILALAAQGESVLIGRGAGFILPRATTLHVRVWWRRWPTASPT